MKASEFRKLIREEVHKALKEVRPTPALTGASADVLRAAGVRGYKPIGLEFQVVVAGRTNDGKNITRPFKLMPDHKVKLSIIEKGDGTKVPSVQYLTIFRSQLIRNDLGKIAISFNIPWGPVDKMGEALTALIAKTYSQDTAKLDRGTLSNAKDLKNLLDKIVSEKWPLLTDDAINNPKALQMMYGMGAAIERVAAVQQ